MAGSTAALAEMGRLVDERGTWQIDRRSLLRIGVVGAAAGMLGTLAGERLPRRDVAAASDAARRAPSDIQHDIMPLLPPARAIDGVLFRAGPAFTYFVTARLRRTPTRADQRMLAEALDAVESAHPPGPSGVMLMASYGAAYLDRLPAEVVAAHMPRTTDGGAPVFEEAAPSPTDYVPGDDLAAKRHFRIPVAIERNELLLTLRSDRLPVLVDSLGWLVGGAARLAGKRVAASGLDSLLDVTSKRLMFNAPGLPRKVADDADLPYAARIPNASPMWMGFADHQANGAGPARITTFAGHPAARLTTAEPGDYLDNGSVQHLSHSILDLAEYYLGDPDDGSIERASYTIRLHYMFRANPAPVFGYGTNHGYDGPVFVPNDFHGSDDAELAAQGMGTPSGVRRLGHLQAVQRASRAPDGTPLHIRADGPGFDDLDVPDGSRQPKLHFSIFLPSAQTFASMRRAGAAVDLARKHRVAIKDNGLERFITTTRRQNFLVPPRRHRAFPFVELT